MRSPAGPLRASRRPVAVAALLALWGVGTPAVLVPIAGCAAKQQLAESPLEYSENARKAYEAALVLFFDHEWEAATKAFEEVKRSYGQSRYARLAELRLADIAYRQEKFAEAIGIYKGFATDHPNDPEVPYARLRVIRARFINSGASALLPPLEERDLVNVRDAYADLQGFMDDYPDHPEREELDYMLAVVMGLLVRHELYVAHFYLNRDNFAAAAARVDFALATYPESGLDAEALVLLGETYLKMKRVVEARAVFRRVLTEHADTPFVVPAREFLRISLAALPPSQPTVPSRAAAPPHSVAASRGASEPGPSQRRSD